MSSVQWHQYRNTAARVPNTPIRLSAPLELAWKRRTNARFVPLAFGGRVLVTTSPEGALSYIEDGAERWRREGSFSTVGLARGRIVAIDQPGSAGRLTELDPSTGAILGSRPCEFSLDALIPERNGFVGVGRYADNGHGTVTLDLAFVDLETLDCRWQLHSSRSRSGLDDIFAFDIACGEGAIFVGRGRSFLSLDLETGGERWAAPLQEFGGGHSAHAPMVSRGRVVIRTPKGTVALDATTGRPVWLLKGFDSGWGMIYEGRVYLALPNTEFCVADLTRGQFLLGARLEDRIRSVWGFKEIRFATGLVVSETHFFIGDGRGRLYAFQKETAEPVWFHQPKGTNGYLGAQPAVDGNRLYLVSGGNARRPGALYCYEAAPASELG